MKRHMKRCITIKLYYQKENIHQYSKIGFNASILTIYKCFIEFRVLCYTKYQIKSKEINVSTRFRKFWYAFGHFTKSFIKNRNFELLL